MKKTNDSSNLTKITGNVPTIPCYVVEIIVAERKMNVEYNKSVKLLSFLTKCSQIAIL